MIRLRFGLDDGQPRTLDQIGKLFGLSARQVRQIEREVMTKLRNGSGPTSSAPTAARPGPSLVCPPVDPAGTRLSEAIAPQGSRCEQRGQVDSPCNEGCPNERSGRYHGMYLRTIYDLEEEGRSPASGADRRAAGAEQAHREPDGVPDGARRTAAGGR